MDKPTPSTPSYSAPASYPSSHPHTGQPFDLSEATRTTNPFTAGGANGIVASPSRAFSCQQSGSSGREDDAVDHMPLPGTRTQGVFDTQHIHLLAYVAFLAGTSQSPDEGLLRLMRKHLKVGVLDVWCV